MGVHIGIRQRGMISEKANSEDVFIVFNGSFAVRYEEMIQSNSKMPNIFVKNTSVFNEESEIETSRIEPCEYYDLISDVLELPRWFRKRLEQQGHVHGSPPFSDVSTDGQRFVRFSAYANDRRVTARGGLLPGSYATSFLDASTILTALSAVGHYALPNIAPPQYRFEISPPPLTDLHYGTALPNFGQSGGGTEIEFFRGVPDGHVSGPLMMPVY